MEEDNSPVLFNDIGESVDEAVLLNDIGNDEGVDDEDKLNVVLENILVDQESDNIVEIQNNLVADNEDYLRPFLPQNDNESFDEYGLRTPPLNISGCGYEVFDQDNMNHSEPEINLTA